MTKRRKARGAGQIGLTKGQGGLQPWTGEDLRLDPVRLEMSGGDDARLIELVGRGLTLTQIAPLMGGKTYATLHAAMERLGLVHDVPAIEHATSQPRPSLYGAWETQPTRGLFIAPTGAPAKYAGGFARRAARGAAR